MITKNELNLLKMSATKKDFYQIWNELLDLAGKISDRWDPKSTNESDPGIVLLKVLAALGDKLNYTIDASINELYMPTAAQRESMQKLCEMMGYNIKYYQSAITDVSISVKNLDKLDATENYLQIPMFTPFYNIDKDINYVSIENKILTPDKPNQIIKCMEGQIVRCTNNTNNIITATQLDDNQKYYLPENQIAENGIFIYKISDSSRSSRWLKVDNLNTRSYDTTDSYYIYKFGYDSTLKRPYIQFPEDISQIIGDGLEIYYLRTSGLKGNISMNTLVDFEKPTSGGWSKLSEEDYKITNMSAAVNGRNIETLDQAYNNYKKTIGTFDTLVTCRDYMNAIYNLIDDAGINAVSNVIVSDIRDDINRSVTLCSFGDYGIEYSNKAIQNEDGTKKINNFDLVLYPFKKIQGLNSAEEYKDSFKYFIGGGTKAQIEAGIKQTKNIAHNFVYPNENDIVCIKNYLKLDARITTTEKVNIVEEKNIINAIKAAIFEKFNAHMLDFGEEIPFETILDCIENADVRIKNVSLDEPILYTKFALANGDEYDTADTIITESSNDNIATLNVYFPGREAYNKLALRNILAGKLELFNYEKSFSTEFDEGVYNYTAGAEAPYKTIYPSEDTDKKLIELLPECSFNITDNTPINLKENECIKFRAPNLKTVVTYPAYINYYIHLIGDESLAAIPASFISFRTYMDKAYKTNWESLAKNSSLLKKDTTVTNGDTFLKSKTAYGALFTKVGATYKVADNYESTKEYYYIPIDKQNFVQIAKWIAAQTYSSPDGNKNLLGLFAISNTKTTNIPGYLLDNNYNKYRQCTEALNFDIKTAIDNYFVQQTFAETTADHTYDGLGRNEVLSGIKANEEYQLQPGEYLLINYTPSSKDSNETTMPQNIFYGDGTIITATFELNDSEKVNASGIQFSKTNGFDFSNYLPGSQNIKGMFSVGTKDQICIRDLVKVTLNNPITYLYWNLKDETALAASLTAAINEVDQIESAKVSYTLEDGEYFYYTDINKTDIAYYGAGTELTFCGGISLTKPVGIKEASIEDIQIHGVSIVPWIAVSLSDTKKIIIQEYKYISLVNGDSLNLNGMPEGSSVITKNLISIPNTAEVSYTLNNETKKLPKISIKDEQGNNYFWEVRSKLLINTSPIKAQALNNNDQITLVFDDGSTEIIKNKNDKQINFKTNYVCQSSLDRVNVRTNQYLDNKLLEINNFKIKLFDKVVVGLGSADSGNIFPLNNFHNFNNKWTEFIFNPIDFGTEAGAYKFIKLKLNVPSGYFGLFMINYSGGVRDLQVAGPNSKDAYLEAKTAEKNANLVIFNYPNSSQETWWENRKDTSSANHKYYLRKGINIIRVNEACELYMYPDENKEGKLILSDLSLIRTDNIINNKLIQYQGNSNETYTEDTSGQATVGVKYLAKITNTNNSKVRYDSWVANSTTFPSGAVNETYKWFKLNNENALQILDDIRLLDPDYDFYYNCLVDNSSALNLNINLARTEESNTLASPSILYDYNNINNKFVISEIDADYLDTGIAIVRTSKF